MKTRVLELLKEPKHIQREDLQVLKDQIQEYPYLQTVRALHLYGVHLYDSENYQKELSKTAAYTTDKKNLYHLINGTIETKQIKITVPKVSTPVEDKKPFPSYIPKNGGFPLKRTEEKLESITDESIFTAVQPLPEVQNPIVEVEGERNRILFAGEENFLNEENTAKIDLESSRESGNLVTEKRTSVSELQSETTVEAPELKFGMETIEDEKEKSSETTEDQTDKISIIPEESVVEITSENQKNLPSEAEETLTDEAPLNFNESEIRVSPENNLEQAVEAIAEDQAVSFQEIAPFETETSTVAEDQPEEKTIQNESQNKTDFTPETIISEDKIATDDEKLKVEDDAQLSFHGTESFLPDVKIEAKTPVQKEIPVQNTPSKNKYEEEMRRLIEQVELKMKQAKTESEKKEKVPENEEAVANSEISFAETQSFEIQAPKVEAEIQKEASNVSADEKDAEKKDNFSQSSAITETEETELSTGWKPMSLEPVALDSTIGKKPETPENKTEVQNQQTAAEQKKDITKAEETASSEVITEKEHPEETIENRESETEVKEASTEAFNVSFFGNSISSFIKSNQSDEPEKQPEPTSSPKVQPDKREIPSILDSNVPGFINTWQSWLKIDRTAEQEKEKTEIKEKAIETFLENNPKISQLKEEVSFVIKERNDDISHLMTETLAKLYTEQKLYSKAIQAYQILIGKHPDKKTYFEERIQEVKDTRGR